MWKACAKCGRIHDYNKKCYIGDYKKKKDTDINKFRNTMLWTNKSIEIRENSNYLCSVCLDKGIFNYKRIEVHHIDPLCENFERRLDNYNLIALCKEHHKEAEDGKIQRDYLFNIAKAREDSL